MSAPAVSFEFFPPKSLQGSFRLWDTVRALAPLSPEWVSVTYGAGGTTRQLTREAVAAIGGEFDLRVAGHLTCVDASREETLEVAEGFREAGVEDIVALRGDPPKGADRFTPHPDGFADSVELVGALAERGFRVRVGAYPDRHPEAADADADVAWLKRKIDAGAAEAVTQFFFDPETFLRFRDRCAAAGIEAPIVPGILPVENWSRTRGFAERCGAVIPDELAAAFDVAERDGRADLFAIAQCAELCDRLVEEGCGHLHFYTLNRPDLTRDVCAALGRVAAPSLEAVA
ncbi:methylenetetrahydrofolate reductase [NAD(P)H] [Jannaschia aquimarina]|uniref:Methylenetetrahydrofolate reductase n=1 Tax=Jannaschia aquimarina TaxID=935700 RepID=A0A0D1EFH3_9RHOB|nr:methylenetetrahydrofolate reductase [NAD(P)H] [Jannaschia aquimarina]KIT16384.1 5,10-methylenetetrahydrofolate reductase [Jannaschia aquimarina]SNT05304.1 5,10-methylenetetrahydrofolate reductase (NAD(P)) [Jannaschia aquimarina]